MASTSSRDHEVPLLAAIGAEYLARRLLASSKPMRLKPQAIDVRIDADPIHNFLGDPEAVRSSFYLEECATEFQVQGLELDRTCATWDAVQLTSVVTSDNMK